MKGLHDVRKEKKDKELSGKLKLCVCGWGIWGGGGGSNKINSLDNVKYSIVI